LDLEFEDRSISLISKVCPMDHLCSF
jgi:hypothetical protein